jgi:hypothetical protein
VAAFSRGRLLLALPISQALFRPGSLRRSTERMEDDMHDLLRQMTAPYRIIDILEGRGSPTLL